MPGTNVGFHLIFFVVPRRRGFATSSSFTWFVETVVLLSYIDIRFTQVPIVRNVTRSIFLFRHVFRSSTLKALTKKRTNVDFRRNDRMICTTTESSITVLRNEFIFSSRPRKLRIGNGTVRTQLISARPSLLRSAITSAIGVGYEIFTRKPSSFLLGYFCVRCHENLERFT